MFDTVSDQEVFRILFIRLVRKWAEFLCNKIYFEILDGGLDPSPHLFLPNALLDLVALNFLTMGDVLTRDPGTKGVLKSSNMLWCYLLSVPLFKRDSKVSEWCCILLIFLGGFVKVSVSIHGLFRNIGFRTIAT